MTRLLHSLLGAFHVGLVGAVLVTAVTLLCGTGRGTAGRAALATFLACAAVALPYLWVRGRPG